MPVLGLAPASPFLKRRVSCTADRGIRPASHVGAQPTNHGFMYLFKINSANYLTLVNVTSDGKQTGKGSLRFQSAYGVLHNTEYTVGRPFQLPRVGSSADVAEFRLPRETAVRPPRQTEMRPSLLRTPTVFATIAGGLRQLSCRAIGASRSRWLRTFAHVVSLGYWCPLPIL